MRPAVPAFAAVVFACYAAVHAQTPADADEARIWTGVYTAEQAQRGKGIYEAYCTRCHGLNLLGGRQGGVGGPALKDANFWVSWERAPLSTLYGKIERTMPLDSPASLRTDDYTDVVAYILAENAFPSGKADLPATGLDGIRIARRAGETAEVPNFSLVQVVGCLTGTGGKWTLTQATSPTLTRSEASDAASLAAAAKSSPGTSRLRLIGAGHLTPEQSREQRVEVRGLLDKSVADDVRLDVLSLKAVGSSCTQ